MKESRGYGTAAIILIGACLAAFFAIYSPTVGGLEEAKNDLKATNEKLNEAKVAVITPSSETLALSKKIRFASVSEIQDRALRAGFPAAAISLKKEEVGINYAASPDEIAAAISELTGSPRLDPDGQIAGKPDSVFKAEFDVKQEGAKSRLIATLTPVS